MDSIDLIRDNLINSAERVLLRIEEMEPHALVAPTPNGGGHTLWILGHLAYIEGLVIQTFMLGRPNPLADYEEVFDGADVSADPAVYPSFSDALAMCRSARDATLDVLDGLSEADLDQVAAAAPDGYEALFGTYRRCLQMVADHWYMHRGQLADARRATGLERMWL